MGKILGGLLGFMKMPRQQAAPDREDPNVEEARRREVVSQQMARGRGATLLGGAMAPANPAAPSGPGAALLFGR